MSSWIAPLLRALPAIAMGLVVTFSADHSAPVGLVTFGVFAVLTGGVIAGFAWREERSLGRTVALIQGVVSVVAGVAALAVIGGGLPYLVFVVSGWGVITGFLELYAGIRSRRVSSSARDQIFVGALTVVLAVVLLLLPPDFAQSLGGIEKVEGELTASIIVVGLLGAYWAIVGVFLVIAALSLKWAKAATPVETSA